MNRLKNTHLKVGMTLLVPQLDEPLAPLLEELDDSSSTALAFVETLESGVVEVSLSTVGTSPGNGRVLQHKVRAGETLGHIASRYGVKVASLEQWNHLRGIRYLRIGQELIVYPGASAAGGRPPDATSDRLVHHVESGDSMWSIARKYTVSLDDLMRWNHLTDRNTLQIGQRIDIPPLAQRRSGK